VKNYIKDNQQFLIIALVWLITGLYAGPLVFFIVPVSLILMYNKGMHLEIFLGFFFILTLSDSRLVQLGFAANVKNIYLLVIALISLKEMKYLKEQIFFYKYFYAFFIVALVALIFSPTISLSFQKTLSYILLFIFVPNYILYIYQEYGTYFFKSVVFLVTLILILGLIFNFIDPEITNLVGRYRGLLGNPNGLGLYVFIFILLFATLNEHFPNLFGRNEKLFVYCLSFFCLIKCGARASLISTLMFFFFKRFYKISPLFGFVIFITTVFVYQIVSDNLVDIIVNLGLGQQFRVETLENGSGRIIAWQFAWQEIQNNLFLGKGFSYTEYLFHKNYEYLSRLGHEGMAHNSYLTFWLDTGLVGLISFMIGLMFTFIKAAQKSTLAIPILYSILFSNYYESWLTASLNPFTIQLLFILTIIYIYDLKFSNEFVNKVEYQGKNIHTDSSIHVDSN
jgi:O-antigen ligase